MLQEGLGSIRVRYLGDKQVLLNGQDGASFSEVIEACKESLCKIFYMLQPWGESNVVGNKVVWNRYRGLPLSLWTVDCFRKILGNVGTLVDMNEATTLNWECVEFACLKVKAAVASKVQICENVWINVRVYQITVEEESSSLECVKSKCWYKEDNIGCKFGYGNKGR